MQIAPLSLSESWYNIMLKKAIKGLRNAELIIAGTLFCACLL